MRPLPRGPAPARPRLPLHGLALVAIALATGLVALAKVLQPGHEAPLVPAEAALVPARTPVVSPPVAPAAALRIDRSVSQSPVATRAATPVITRSRTRYGAVHWRISRSVGLPWSGRLYNGVLLPAQGATFFTWDGVLGRSPNPEWRRNGTDTLVRTLLGVLAAYHRAHPGAARVGVGDLSRPSGGTFGSRYGGSGHVSHQNGLDADLYYPRLDGREAEPSRPGQIDHRLAQDLVNSFVRAGAQFVFVGPNTGLSGPSGTVQELAHHDDHLHVRILSPDRSLTAPGQ